MSNPNKTIADIVAEKRARANEIEGAAGRDANQFQRELIADLRAEADELEAAAKRERERVEADALAVGGIVEASRRTHGNAAALREAMVEIWKEARKQYFADNGIDLVWLMAKVAEALAAPPRNCDRYHDEGEARSAWYKENPCGSCHQEKDTCALCYGEWIFATAKKGATDGSK